MDNHHRNVSIVFFLPDVIGGVGMVVSNIVNFDRGNHRSKLLIYKDVTKNRIPFSNKLPASTEVVRFTYDNKENIHYTVRRMWNKVKGDEIVVVATDSLELEMVNLLHIDRKVIFILMGDFEHYYLQAIRHESVINGFIAISNEIFEKLVLLLPHRRDNIFRAYFPTPNIESGEIAKRESFLRVIYVGRLEQSKNPLILVEVEKQLQKLGVRVAWSIVGAGELLETLKNSVSGFGNFSFKGIVENDQLHRLYQEHDLFIMTSITEGLPVSLIEAMKAGLVPIVSDIKGGIREVVVDGKNGFLCSHHSAMEFAEKIKLLSDHPDVLSSFSKNAKSSSSLHFDAFKNSSNYYSIIDSIPFVAGSKKFTFVPTRSLDKRWIPSNLVKWLRSIRKLIN